MGSEVERDSSRKTLHRREGLQVEWPPMVPYRHAAGEAVFEKPAERTGCCRKLVEQRVGGIRDKKHERVERRAVQQHRPHVWVALLEE